MNLRRKINERAIDLDNYPDTYLAARKKDVDAHKQYSVAFKEIVEMIKRMSWKDITFINGTTSGGTRMEFPLLPEDIRAKIKASARINSNLAKSNFTIGSLSFAKTFNDAEPSTDSNIYMKVDSAAEGQRSHFPNNGIPVSLKGTNLGYKLYRALLQKFKYLRSNTGGTTSKDYAWQSLVSTKRDAQGNLTEDDVHGIVAKSAVFAMIKSLSNEEKIRYASNFINSSEVDKSTITRKNFAMDEELKAILPDSILIQVDPTRREEAERNAAQAAEAERKRREEAALRTHSSRFELYAPFGVNDYSWEIGDYIVVRSYLMDPADTTLKVRKVVEKNGREYIALKMADIPAYEATGAINDPRKTSDKTLWVKSRLKPGQYSYMPDPTAGRLAIKGTPNGTPAVVPPTTHDSGRRRPSTNTNATNTEGEQTSQQRRLVMRFMSGEFNVCIKTSDWTTRGRKAIAKQPITTYIVKKMGVGNSATYSVMDGRTGELQHNLSTEAYNALGLKKFSIVQLERKSSVAEGDWVFVKDHRSAQGYACVVYRITPASNRQPGLYIWTGEDRPQYIGQPRVLYKLVPDANESIKTSLYRFDELI